MSVILFDIDGTLILTGGAGQEALVLAMQNEFKVAEPERVPVHGCTDRGIAANLFSAHEIEDNDENWERFRESYLHYLQLELPQREGQVLPGVSEMLERMHASDSVRLGLLTGNTQAGATIKLKYYGLDHFFDFGGYGDFHPQRNDVARAARMAVRETVGDHIQDDQVWVIGDTPNDVICGKSINAKVLAVTTGGCSRETLAQESPDVLLDDLSQGDSWLTQLKIV